jgi:hypothetical protein
MPDRHSKRLAVRVCGFPEVQETLVNCAWTESALSINRGRSVFPSRGRGSSDPVMGAHAPGKVKTSVYRCPMCPVRVIKQVTKKRVIEETEGPPTLHLEACIPSPLLAYKESHSLDLGTAQDTRHL